MVVWSVAAAVAAEPAPAAAPVPEAPAQVPAVPAPAPPDPAAASGAAPEAPPVDPLQAAQALADRDAAIRVAERLDRLLSLATTVTDDRWPTPVRLGAASELAKIDDPRVVGILRGAVADRDPAFQQGVAVAALTSRDPAAVTVPERVILDPLAPREVQTALVAALGDHGTAAAGQALFDISGAEVVPARVRSLAVRTLSDRYPEVLERLGGAPSVVDPFGGALFVGANAVVGGVALSSVGVWGQFDAGTAIGAVGGAAVGIGGGAVYAGTHPLTFGQGLTYASGVGWGLTASLWTTTAIHGGWQTIRNDAAVAGPAAAYRALGVLGGAAVGAIAMRSEP
ncbi:MAG: HEAT repeat domain-containing protein, partial [Myxococcota bacterium]